MTGSPTGAGSEPEELCARCGDHAGEAPRQAPPELAGVSKHSPAARGDSAPFHGERLFDERGLSPTGLCRSCVSRLSERSRGSLLTIAIAASLLTLIVIVGLGHALLPLDSRLAALVTVVGGVGALALVLRAVRCPW